MEEGAKRKREAEPLASASASSAAAASSTAAGLDAAAVAAAGRGGDAAKAEASRGAVNRDLHTKSLEQRNEIMFLPVHNDGRPESMIYMIHLKNIFCRQLPRMPKEYIARLVLDRNHRGLALVRKDVEPAKGRPDAMRHKVIGGILFRPFFEQRFAEIVFLAVTNQEQVKGYGSRLMNHLKQHVKTLTPPITHFLTYADNYATGYFRKQGFTKNLTMDVSNWVGWIKDYDGGTLMECRINMDLDYLDLPNILKRQKECVAEKVKQRSNSHVVYDGYDGVSGSSPLKVEDIRGVKESGFELKQSARPRDAASQRKHRLQAILGSVLRETQRHSHSWPFLDPVNTDEVPDYLTHIKDPIDLTTIESRLSTGSYYLSKEMFTADMVRMCNNCRIYNEKGSVWYNCAQVLEAYIRQKLEQDSAVL